MARIDERRPEYVVNEKLTYVGDNRWETLREFLQSSLEVFWNGQKLHPFDSENGIDYDYEIIGDRTIKIVGANSSNNSDLFICNYIVKS